MPRLKGAEVNEAEQWPLATQLIGGGVLTGLIMFMLFGNLLIGH